MDNNFLIKKNLNEEELSEKNIILDTNNSQDDALIYLIGGRNRGKTLSKIERYSIMNNKWEKCQNLNDARGSTSACSVGNFIYVLGGGGIKSNLSTCERLNIITNEWESIGDISIARHALSAISINSNIYVIGGWIAGTISSCNVEKYDTEKNEWTQLENILVPRRLHGITNVHDKIYIFGGQTNYGVIDDVECYHINENKWSLCKRMPMVGCTQAVTINDEVYILIMPKCIFKYIYKEDIYEKVPNGDFPLEEWYGFTCVAYKEKIYVFGGTSKGRYCDDVFTYNITNFTWEKLDNMHKARRRSTAVLVNVNKI